MSDEIFGGFAADYDRHRPDYPAALWETLLADAANPSDVVDVGSGTGRAALELARRCHRVTAVEPEEGMRREAERRARELGVTVTQRAGSAEATGLEDRCADLVVCAQAFHWFEPARALPELRRVLRRDGRLAVWWNDRRVDGVSFMERYEEFIERYNPNYRRGYRERDWAAILTDGGHFESVTEDRFPHAKRVDAEGFIALACTSSYLRNALDAAQLRAFADELRGVLHEHHGDGEFDVPYVTLLYRGVPVTAP